MRDFLLFILSGRLKSNARTNLLTLKNVGRFFVCLTVYFVFFGAAKSHEMQFVVVLVDGLYNFTTHGKRSNGTFLEVYVLPRVVTWIIDTKSPL